MQNQDENYVHFCMAIAVSVTFDIDIACNVGYNEQDRQEGRLPLRRLFKGFEGAQTLEDAVFQIHSFLFFVAVGVCRFTI